MKKILAAIVLISLLYTQVMAQVKMPAPSPVQTVKQDFGMDSIELIYSRPGTKGRKVFGDLVPNGKLWRTGANEATRITFTETVEIGGKKIDSGTYAVYTIPGEDSWEIILNKGIQNWGIDGYKEAEDVARFKIMPVKTKTMVETFTMQFTNIKAESCDLEILWEKTIASIRIRAEIKEKLRAQIEAALTTGKKPYWEAAQFYKEYDNNLPKALENVNKALEGNEKAFWIFLYKAKIQKELGDNAAALATSKTSLTLAREASNDDYVKMNQELQKELRQ